MSRQRQRQGESREPWEDITNINKTRPHPSPKLSLVKSLNQILESELPEIKSAGRGLLNLLNLHSVINLMGPMVMLWNIFPGLAIPSFPKHTKLFISTEFPVSISFSSLFRGKIL